MFIWKMSIKSYVQYIMNGLCVGIAMSLLVTIFINLGYSSDAAEMQGTWLPILALAISYGGPILLVIFKSIW